MKLLGWFFFFFFGGGGGGGGVDLSLWHCFLIAFCCEFHWWLVWVCEQPLCWDFFVKFAILLEDFAKERKIWKKKKKKRLWLLQCYFKPSMFLGKMREMGRREGKRENGFFFFGWRVKLGLAGIKHTFTAAPNPI